MPRDTKLGAEEITRDSPNISDEVPPTWMSGASCAPVPRFARTSGRRAQHRSARPAFDAEERLPRAIFGRRLGPRRDTSR